MNINVENQSIVIQQVIYNDQGFGQPSGLPEVVYEISLLEEELQDIFGQQFDDFIMECEADDAKYDGLDIPELKALGYPKLNDALKECPSLFAFLVKEYVYFNLFDQLLCLEARDSWVFAINSITEVIIKNGMIRITGFGYWLSES